MTKQTSQSSLLAALAAGAGLLAVRPAQASNPLEYPDNGAAQFSRGGAWLATGTDPIAAHYNPAAMSTQKSGFSIDMNLNFNKVCYDRRGPGNTITGPSTQISDPSNPAQPLITYLPACAERRSFPFTVPSVSLVWRATEKLAIGFAIVPPATNGAADREFGDTALGYNSFTKQTQQVAAPWRYQTMRELSTIVFPTVSVGYEILKNFRLGVGFVSGFATIDTQATGYANAQGPDIDLKGDHSADDAVTNVATRDLFVPGIVASIHWSVLPQLDLSVWGRFMDDIKSKQGEVNSRLNYYNSSGVVQPECVNPAGYPNSECPASLAQPNPFPNAKTPNPIRSFRYPIPPEIRLGVRFHQPRSQSRMAFETGGIVRDPLHDDVFDIEVNGSYTMNSKADRIELRFNPDSTVLPTAVPLPAVADRITGYKDSYGLRVGGQWNVVQDKLGIRAGGWYESQSQDPAYLSVNPVGAARYGFGGGLVFRQDFLDVSIGYQRLMSSGLDNQGNGKQFAAVGAGGTAEGYTFHAINGGRITFSGHAFSLGGVVRF